MAELAFETTTCARCGQTILVELSIQLVEGGYICDGCLFKETPLDDEE